MSTLLIPGATCWKTVRADRFALIQDAGPAFAAMADAMAAARRSIFILGWDIDSRTLLRPVEGASPADGNGGAGSCPLLPFLLDCLERQPALEIFVLLWDYAIIYAFEREPWPRQQFERAHPRLRFALASDHGAGGSHHQKVVVVDDAVAFVGGVDLTLHRWDLPEHQARDRRRLDVDGHEYGPFHDVHTAVAGPAAAALGALARQRWRSGRRFGARLPPPPAEADASSIWPRGLPVDAHGLEVGLARTLVCQGQPPVREIASLTTRMIAAASRRIYAENQYLTSALVVRTLGERLAQPGGPEVIIVLPVVETGWMEQGSMGVLRDEALARLRQQDVEGRLRLVSPVVMDGAASVPVAVHAKVLVIDERVAKIGSANFTNRSLGVDSECDLAIEAVDDESAALVASVRDRLLGEHLGLDVSEVARRLALPGASLRALVDNQAPDAARRLVPLPLAGAVAAFDFTALDGAMVDPTEPWSVDGLLGRAVPVPLRRRLARRWMRPLLGAVAVLVAWALLRHGPLRDFHLGAAAIALGHWLHEQPAGPLMAAGAVAVTSCLFVPITLLATATLTVFGAWPGMLVIWSGAVLGATLSHAIGERWGERLTAWLPARLAATARKLLGRRAFWSVVLMRLLPVGNFGALNLLAGALKTPRRAFIFGNAAGLAPGILGLGVLVSRALAALRRPDPLNVALAAAAAIAVAALSVLAKRRFRSAPTDALGKARP